MQLSNLTPIKDKSTLPFFVTNEETRAYYKVYNDGGHYIASLPQQKQNKTNKAVKSELDVLFDMLYDEGVNLDFSSEELKLYIRNGLIEEYPNYPNIDDYLNARFERKLHNFYARRKRFKRKADLNKWNYFITFTYDDKLLDEATFEKKLRNCLSHLKCRRGWRYMGKFERAPETGRLHFHGIAYIPEGELMGKTAEKSEYSTSAKKMVTTNENDFFRKNYGKNDFQPLDEYLLKTGKTIHYILKYIQKDGQRIIYSRGIPTEIFITLTDDDIITEMQDFICKFVLFDDAINWERDILNGNRIFKQCG